MKSSIWLVLTLMLAGFSLGSGLVSAQSPDADFEAGKRLYREGVLASGAELAGKGFGDVEIRGEYAACVRCHRPSGFGSYEGGYYIPPITAPYMFGGRQISRDDRFRALFMQAQTAEFRHQVRRVRDRPPYDTSSLGTLLREGVDTNGRSLETLMPRYALSDQDLVNLEAYLRTLSSTLSPGVDNEYVELATVIHVDVPAHQREAMLGTLQSFVDWYNKRTLGDMQLAGHSVYGSSLYTRYSRLYRLNVWEIDGPPETWREQLETYYTRTPVFALVSGQVDGPWREVGAFCDELGLPAVFPITDMPHDVGHLGGYSVYFNAGLQLEADLMRDWLVQNGSRNVLQIFDPARPGSEFPASRMREAIDGSGVVILATVELDDWRRRVAAGISDNDYDTLVIWQEDPSSEELISWQKHAGADSLLLPSSALDSADIAVMKELGDSVLFSYPKALEQNHYPERFRARAWMNTRGLDYSAQTVQYRAYYAMLMFRDSFVHLLDHYHRDYLLEVLEHQIQGSPNPGLYPDMELAPGQRFASKSGYIVALEAGKPSMLRQVGDRIVP